MPVSEARDSSGCLYDAVSLQYCAPITAGCSFANHMDLVSLKKQKQTLGSCSGLDRLDALQMNKTFTVSACVTVWLRVISGSLKWGRVGTDFTASGKPSQCVCVYFIYGSCAEARGQTALQCVMCAKRLRAHICACNDNDFVHAGEPECHRFLERHVSSERGRLATFFFLFK